MIKLTNLKETDNIKPLMLRAYIARKITALMEEYSVDNLDDIGCFIVLEKNEFSEFPMMSEMEFVEMLEFGDKMYLHSVRIVSDNYAEDYLLEIERT
ncbi:hypothetical protein [Porcipelethomonas sp.]|uniref:hypothetical protein n=1 Tax=Porcipelethomonas sp. TaxID=2981675 RepID=UPI003EF787D1